MRILKIDRGVLELSIQWAAHELLGVLVTQSSHVLIDGCSSLFQSQSRAVFQLKGEC